MYILVSCFQFQASLLEVL